MNKRIGLNGFTFHMQGFAVDNERKYIYWSFTDSLVKSDFDGNIIKRIDFKDGHLGDIDYYDGRIYGSLLGAPKKGDQWDAWTGIYVEVFDTDLNLLVKKDIPYVQKMRDALGTPENPKGIVAIDGTTVGKAPDGSIKLFLASAIDTGEKYSKQVILQHSMDMVFEKEYAFEVGSAPFGIQNLDYDWESGHFWFTCYGPAHPYQMKDVLFEVDRDLKTVLGRWQFDTPYGFVALGGRQFFTSESSGGPGDYRGLATLCIADEKDGMKAL